VIYEVTGLSDIIRGSSEASETATAQQIKSQYGSMRLKEMQQDVARFATDILNIKAQIMSDLYRPETLKLMSGIEQTEDAQYADQAIALLKSESMRNYRIEIATDSMVEMDEQAEKQGRIEFLTAAGGFLKEAAQAAQMAPELAPLMGEMLMFGVRAFKASRPIEAAFEQFVAKANEPKQPKQDPEQLKLQAEQQQAAAKMQSDQAIAQAQGQAKMQIAQAQAQAQQQTDAMRQQMEERQHAAELDMKARMDAMQAQFDDQEAQRKMQFEQWKVAKQIEGQITVAEISANRPKDLWYGAVSLENLDTVKPDVFIAWGDDQATVDRSLANPLLAQWAPLKTGGDIWITDKELARATTSVSIISMAWALDRYVPLLAGAVAKTK
jgi:hypothetical protein